MFQFRRFIRFFVFICFIRNYNCESKREDLPIQQDIPVQLKPELQNSINPTEYTQFLSPNSYFPPNNIFPGINFPSFSSYYPPTNSYPSWNYCIPPQLSPTYYVCPEPFYYFEYAPLLTTSADEAKRARYKLSDYLYPQPPPPHQFYAARPTPSPTPENEYNYQNNPEFQAQGSPNATLTSSPLQGPIWEILKQTYDKCCPLNRNRLKPIQTRDEIQLFQRLFNSFGKLNNSLQGQGIYGIVENFDAFQSLDTTSSNSLSVQLLSSSGFYLINRRELNGAPTATPIALSILLNMWPLLVIIILANAYAAIFIWLLDKTMNTGNFSPKFLQGTLEGTWWSYLMFVANGFTPYVDIKRLIQRVFVVIWIMISLVIIVIFIAMFTTALTSYAINGQSLNQKVIGFNKYSIDRPWLDLENAMAVEYNDLSDMFKDLDDLKLDFIALDQVYANFYSRLINERFYVMKFIPRKRSYNIALRGFNPEQISCFHTIAGILQQQWLKSNLSSNDNKLTDKGKYFSLTDELLFPQRNVILITAVGLLAVIFIVGIAWQVACMSDSALSRFTGRSSGRFRFPGRSQGRRRAPGRRNVSFDDRGRDEVGGIGRAIANTVSGGGGRTGGGGGGNAGGLDAGRVLENISNTVSGIGDILNFRASPPVDFDDGTERSVKFNPLVHYYNNDSRYDDEYTQKKDKYRPLQEQPIHETNSQQGYKYYRVNDKGFEEVVKEQSCPLRSNNNTQMQPQIQLIKQDDDTQIIKLPNCSKISIITPPISRRDKYVQTLNDANQIDTTYASDATGYYQHLRPSLATPVKTNITNADLNNSQIKYKKVINFHKGIVLKPTSSTTNFFNHESNTDDNFNDTTHILANHNNNYNNNTPEHLSYISNPNYNPNIKVTVINPDKILELDDLSSSSTTNSSNNNNNNISSITENSAKQTASAMSNNSTLIAGLARNESFYLTEFANVKL